MHPHSGELAVRQEEILEVYAVHLHTQRHGQNRNSVLHLTGKVKGSFFLDAPSCFCTNETYHRRPSTHPCLEYICTLARYVPWLRERMPEGYIGMMTDLSREKVRQTCASAKTRKTGALREIRSTCPMNTKERR